MADIKSDRIIWNGNPGERWRNTGQRIRYQFVCNFANSCGVCIQYHLAISNGWPIPLHRSCRCSQLPVFVGMEARPFEDFRKILVSLSRDQQTVAIGRSNFTLLEKGVIAWDDIVTPTRVRDFKEVVKKLNLDLPALERAGVRPDIARHAVASVRTPQQEIVRARRRELIENIRNAGISPEQLRTIVGRGVGQSLRIAAGPSRVQALPKVAPRVQIPEQIIMALDYFAPGITGLELAGATQRSVAAMRPAKKPSDSGKTPLKPSPTDKKEGEAK